MKFKLKVMLIAIMMLFMGESFVNIAKAAPEITMSKLSGSTVAGGTELTMTVKDVENKITSLKYNWVGSAERNLIPENQNPSNEVRVTNLVVGNEVGTYQLNVIAVNKNGEETRETFFYEVRYMQQIPTNIPEMDGYTAQSIINARKAAFEAYMADEEPIIEDPVKHYLVIGKPLMGFKSGMSDADIEKWESIVNKYEAGDSSWNMDTNPFRQAGNFSSYVDKEGNLNGWLYAGDGIGGYVPVSKGEVMESQLRPDAVYYTPDGEAYTVGKDGKLTLSGTVDWAKYGEYIGPQPGYHYDGGYFWSHDDNGNLRRYDYATAPKSVLAREGYTRVGDAIMPMTSEERGLYEEWEKEKASNQNLEGAEQIDPGQVLSESVQVSQNTGDVSSEINLPRKMTAAEAEYRKNKMIDQLNRFLSKKGPGMNVNIQAGVTHMAKENGKITLNLIKQAEKRAVETGLTSSIGRQMIEMLQKSVR